MLTTGIGRSTDVDDDVAAAQAMARAQADLGPRAPSAGLLLLGAEYDHRAVVAAVAARWPGLPLIGCTTCGDLTGLGGHADDAVTLVLFASDRLSFRAGAGRGLSRSPEAAARQALTAAGVRPERPPALLLTTPDGLTCDVLALTRHPQRGAGGAPVVGGTSADHRKLGPTAQVCGPHVLHDAVTVLAVDGPLRIASGVGSGWTPMGVTHRVTGADGHRLRSIDGRPAIETFRTYLGPEVRDFFGEFPLAVLPTEDQDAFYLRAVFGTEPDGTLVLAGAIPEGARVRVATADAAEVVAGARAAMDDAIARFRSAYGEDARPGAALLFSCAGRRWVLGSRAGDEVAAAAAALEAADFEAGVLAGYFAYGEIAPWRPGGPSAFHNTSCVALLLGEEVHQ